MSRQYLTVLLGFGVIIACVLLFANQARAQTQGSIIFRLDDVQDGFANNGTKAVMDLFMQKKVPLTTAIIASNIGKDQGVVSKTLQGIKSGLFESALHGLRHVDYTTLTPNNQSVSITKGNTVIKTLFGQHPFIFVPPFNSFNNATLSALTSHDMNVVSSTLGTESLQHTKDQIYNASEPCGSSESGRVCIIPVHVSAANDFRLITDNNITQQSNEQIIKQMADNVRNYGYSILVMHPQDFVYTDQHTGKVLQDKADPKQLAQLSALVDKLKSTYKPTSMESLISTMKAGSASFEVLSSAPAQKKVAIITFDDDWIGQHKYAIPILKQFGYNATFFVTCKGPIKQDSSFVRASTNSEKMKQSPDITTWTQLKQIKSMGFDIQNHGMSHDSLVNKPQSVLQKEIVDSKQCLDTHLGIHSTVYAPAFAKPENNATVDSLIAKTGYEFARNGYGNADYKAKRFDLQTNSVNSLDRKFSHNTQAIVSAFGQELPKSDLPVLVYHNINNLNSTAVNWYNSTTTPETFQAEMQWLRDNGYEVHSIRDLSYDSQKGEFIFR